MSHESDLTFHGQPDEALGAFLARVGLDEDWQKLRYKKKEAQLDAAQIQFVASRLRGPPSIWLAKLLHSNATLAHAQTNKEPESSDAGPQYHSQTRWLLIEPHIPELRTYDAFERALDAEHGFHGRYTLRHVSPSILLTTASVIVPAS